MKNPMQVYLMCCALAVIGGCGSEIDATYCVVDLSGGPNARSYSVQYLEGAPCGGFNKTEYKTKKLVLKRVEPGTFSMRDLEERGRQPHAVVLSKPFYMGIFEVTQKQWELVMGSNSCSSTDGGKDDEYPVQKVSYDDIRGPSAGARWPTSNAVDTSSFLGKLREKTKIDFDLPTEAQWEYTCRAGTTTWYCYGDQVDRDYMWCKCVMAHEVGRKLPNDWGFYDMHGNVWEFCLDWYGSLMYGTDPEGPTTGSGRVRRGGGWYSDAVACGSSIRTAGASPKASEDCGFRLASPIPR